MQARDKWVHFVMSQEELERMQQKMDELGIRNKRSYLRKMALDGYCVNLELDDVKEMVSLLRFCSNNLNQYAKRANETGSIYAEDIQDLQNRQNEIWDCHTGYIGIRSTGVLRNCVTPALRRKCAIRAIALLAYLRAFVKWMQICSCKHGNLIHLTHCFVDILDFGKITL